jgi:amidophosphoribosyltransferase
MLLDMQNRGQLAAGMSTFHPDRGFLIETYKQLGTVAEAFRMNRRIKFESLMERLDGSAGIGHVRYATCGLEDRSDAQPFERTHGRKSKWFAFAFNGQLANYQSLRREFLIKGDYHLQRDTDTEIIMHAVSQELADEGPSPDWARLFGRLAERFDGAYNIVLLSAHGEIVVVRDPLGVRPLATAQDGPLFAAASESVPLSNLGFENVRSLEPGTLAVASDQGVRYERFAPARTSAHCFFEWIYFANVASNLDDRSVYLSRAALGRELAALETVPPGPDLVVVPVPDTAKAAADAMAYALELPSVEGLMRNRYVGRTFIESGDNRQSKVRAKYTPLPEVLSGKRVLLVEDSIVRSTTLRALVQEMRKKGGAREIHLRIASPPIIAPCFYGIDMSTRDELIAPKYADLPNGELSAEAQDRLARELGADSLRYLPVEALARSIGLAPNRLCLACVTGQYPTPTGQALFQRQLDEIVTIEPKVATPKLHENGAANGHGHAREENGHTAENGNAGTQPRHDPQSAPARAYERPT